MKTHHYWITVWFGLYVGAMVAHKGFAVAVMGAAISGFFAWLIERMFVRNRNS